MYTKTQSTNLPKTLYVTPTTPIEDENVEETLPQSKSVSKIASPEQNKSLPRKTRASQKNLTPPATSYGVPLLPQEPPSVSVTTKFQSTEDTPTNAPESDGSGYEYLPPSETESNEIVVNKNVYFYKAPRDFEVTPTRKPIKLPKPEKNYKIIFIKAPHIAVPPPIIQVAPQNDEKTLVYVLSKKPEEQPDTVITPAPKEASKPEVYFVKYGVQKEVAERSEKMYGVSQYGKGYYYGAPDSGSSTAIDRSDVVEEKKDEGSKKMEKVQQKRRSFRGVRSSTKNEDPSQRNSLDAGRYFAPLRQRSSVYE